MNFSACSLRKRLGASFAMILSLLLAIAVIGYVGMARSEELAARAHQSALSFFLILTAMAVVSGALIGCMVTRSVLTQLGCDPGIALVIANRIANGDLAVPIDVAAHDQSSLLFAIRKIRDNLAYVIVEVRVGTSSIATASSQISQGVLDLSSRTEQQAASLEETASTVGQLTSTVKQTADYSAQAHQLALAASNLANTGSLAMAQVVDTMDAISHSSRKNVKIVDVIDDIAIQTNMLALDAEVEAGRTSMHTRGFAALVTQVPDLAQRSAIAARKIKALIGDSVGKADTGSTLVAKAGITITEVVAGVRRVSVVIEEIEAASHQQTHLLESRAPRSEELCGLKVLAARRLKAWSIGLTSLLPADVQ